MTRELHCECEIDDGTNHHHRHDCLVGAIDHVANAIKLLGNADAYTQMGAIEAFGVVVKEGLSELSSAVDGLRSDS